MAFWNKKPEQEQVKQVSMALVSSANTLLSRLSQLQEAKKGFLYNHEIRKIDPLIDTAIDRLNMITGDVELVGSNPRNQAILDTFMNDFKVWTFDVRNFGSPSEGYNFYLDTILSNSFEYGVTVRELRTDETGKVIGAYVPESTCLNFQQTGTGNYNVAIYDKNKSRILTEDDFISLFYLMPTGSDPAGNALISGLGFYTEAKLTIIRSLQNYYFRLGDPSLLITSTRDKSKSAGQGDDQKTIMTALSTQLARLWSSRQQGKAMDVTQALPDGVTLDVKVLGEQAIKNGFNCESDLKAIESLQAGKVKLPSWMLGKNWSTTERLSDNERKLIQNEAKSRQNRLNSLVRKDLFVWLNTNGFGNLTETRDYVIKWKSADMSDEKTKAEVEKIEEETIGLQLANIETVSGLVGASNSDLKAMLDNIINEYKEKD